MISTTPSEISLTSRRKSASTNLPLARLRITLGPFASVSTRRMIARTVSPTWNSSVGMRSLPGRIISVLPTVTYVSRCETAETVPETMSPTRSLYSETVFVRSASRIFCMITWRDVCAAMRPRRAAGISTSTVSPSCTGLPWLKRAAAASGMKPGPVSSFEHTSVS